MIKIERFHTSLKIEDYQPVKTRKQLEEEETKRVRYFGILREDQERYLIILRENKEVTLDV
jgi:hypothetical protein